MTPDKTPSDALAPCPFCGAPAHGYAIEPHSHSPAVLRLVLALGQPMGNGQDQAAGRPSAQGDKLLTVAERNIRSFLRSATFKSESDREAALNCVDVLWEAARAPADSVLEDAYMLLQDVAACFTRDDDLPDNLLPRIDAALKARKQGANHD